MLYDTYNDLTNLPELLDLLNNEITPNILKELDFDRYLELEAEVGDDEIISAETTLLLYYINYHFSNYLEAMEELKRDMQVLLAKSRCKRISREEIHALIDEIYQNYDGNGGMK